ncbi:MAG TPA: hypothetical protein VH561_08700 [Micromonosporaceae bacterium]|jgi:hypothetical protein
MACRVLSVACATFVLVVAGCGGTEPGGAAQDHTGGQPSTTASGATFGTEPCAKLVSFEEIAAATGDAPALVDLTGAGECDYEDSAGFGVLTVLLVTDPEGHLSCTSADGTYLGKPVEQISGIGDSAVWSPTAMSLCLVKGSSRVQLSLSTHVDDPKGVTVSLAQDAAGRLT